MTTFGTGSGVGTTPVVCLCALTHTYLLFSVFPYAGYFALFLLNGASGADVGDRSDEPLSDYIAGVSERIPDGLSVDTVGVYAGMLSSAFTFGRLLGFGPWKRMRMRYGERNSLVASLLLSAFFSVTFGVSRSFRLALLSRFMLGVSSGISGIIKRVAINRARSQKTPAEGLGNEEDTEWAVSLLLAFMSFGCAFGPAVSGWMSYYDGHLKYPYLPPNAFGAAMCVTSAALVSWVVVRDDPPTPTPNSNGPSGGSAGERSPLLSRKFFTDRKMDKFSAVWKAKSTRSHLIAYSAFSFCVTCVDEALPLFLIARLGGLGLPTLQVGIVLATAGVITSLLEHSGAAKVLTERFGLYPTLRLSSLANVPLALLPLSLLLDDGGTSRSFIGTTRSSFAFVVILAGVPRALGFLYFSLVGIATGRTVPHCHADDAGHFMTLAALAARAAAPIVAGGMVTLLSPGHPWGIWLSFGFVGAAAAAFTFVLHEAAGAGWRGSGGKRNRWDSATRRQASEYLSERQRALVYARLWEVHYDQGSGTVAARWRRLARKAITLNRLGLGESSASPSGEGHHQDGHPELRRRVSWADRQLRPGIDADDVPFFILGTHKDDMSCQPTVMTPPLMDALQHHLPGAVRGHNYWLKYSLIRDGASLTALESRAGPSTYTVLAVETLEGDILGCFMTIPWRKRSRYERSGQSFLWRMRTPRVEQDSVVEQASMEEDIQVYPWTGENDFCQLFANDKIAVGGGAMDDAREYGGFGFVVDGDLHRGSSYPCKTYGNPCLVSCVEDGGKFVVANMEVWALTPFLFEADAERSEQSIKYREENALQTSSDLCPWSQFL